MIVVDSRISSHCIVRCELCSNRAKLPEADKAGWDWFTGSLRRTYHYCPLHRDSEERNSAFQKSRGERK